MTFIGVGCLLAVTIAAVFLVLDRWQETMRAATEAEANAAPQSIPTQTYDPTLLVIGDSMSAGANNEVIWPELVAEKYDMSLRMLASGGAAYTQENEPFLDQAKELPLLTPAAIIVAGSVNDREARTEKLKSAASELYAYLEDEFPDSPVFIVGPISGSHIEGVAQASDVLKSAAKDAGLPYWNPTAENWLPSMAVVQDDNLHPTDEGQRLIAEQIAEYLEEAGVVN